MFWERGRLDRRFRRLAENPPVLRPAPNGVGRIIVRLAGGKSEQIVGRTLARGPTRATGLACYQRIGYTLSSPHR
jgi:hypothetical protein